jgi:hypothetical protein
MLGGAAIVACTVVASDELGVDETPDSGRALVGDANAEASAPGFDGASSADADASSDPSLEAFSPPAPSPTFSPDPTQFYSSDGVCVTITSPFPDGEIHYTLGGSNPTRSSPLYTGFITLTLSTTIHAVSFAPGYSASAVGSALYKIESPKGMVLPPIVVPGSSNYPAPLAVEVQDVDTSLALCYTLDGSVPRCVLAGGDLVCEPHAPQRAAPTRGPPAS